LIGRLSELSIISQHKINNTGKLRKKTQHFQLLKNVKFFLGLICLLESIFLENSFLTFTCLVIMWKTNKQKQNSVFD